MYGYYLSQEILCSYDPKYFEAISNITAVTTDAIISDLFNKVKDSVIEIITVGDVINPKITIDGAPLVYGGGGSGSGFVFDINGNIVTNYHVTQGADVIYVKFSSGNSYPATIIGEDPYSDLAVIQVDSSALFRENLKPLQIHQRCMLDNKCLPLAVHEASPFP